MKYSYYLLLFGLMVLGCKDSNEEQMQSDTRPNIMVIMLDDMGYSDLGCFGSEIRTPNIDALADEGIRFTNFKTAPMCAPSRAMFLSGNNNVVFGYGRMLRPGRDDALIGKPGYEREISNRIVTFPKLLEDAGYYNAMVGKWHMGYAPQSDPINQGFEDSWVLMEGYSNHFNNRGLGLIGRDTLTEFRSNGNKVPWPKDTFSTEFYTNKMLEYLAKANTQNRPFFAFVSYTAPHWPLQLPDEWLDKDLYKGVYDGGYEVLRQKRFEALRKESMLPANMELPPPMDNFPKWETLTDEQKKRESRKMELYAGMVENADYHIGRLVKQLKESSQYENTIILVLSDNGASNTDFYNHKRGDYCRLHHDNAYGNMGKASSWVGHGTPWANAMMSPFLGYKTWATEGGIAAPLVVKGNAIEGRGIMKKDLITIQDLAPTFLALAGIEYPDSYNKQPLAPMLGKSLVDYWKGSSDTSPHDENSIFAAEQRDHAMLRKGNWKIVSIGKAGDNDSFKLFNLENDLGERRNLSETYPEKRKELLKDWEVFKKEVGMLFPNQ